MIFPIQIKSHALLPTAAWKRRRRSFPSLIAVGYIADSRYLGIGTLFQIKNLRGSDHLEILNYDVGWQAFC